MAHRWRTVASAGTTKERGYGGEHQRLRRAWKLKVDAGGVRCWRCGGPIWPGSRWHLGHSDDRSRYMGPEHPSCNLKAAAKVGYQRQQAAKQGAAAPAKPRHKARVINLAALRRSR